MCHRVDCRSRPAKRNQQVTIICGTDFSENAVQAASAAAAIARQVGEPLTLVHVIPEPLPNIVDEPMWTLLVAHAEKLRAQFNVAVEPLVVDGEADERLIQVARDHEASLIVVAALGTRKAGALAIG